MHAAAYTIGPDIAFGADKYTPGTSEGRRLLAHELTHVVQQERGAVQGPAGFRQSEDIYEQEADVVARSVLSEQHGAALEKTRVGSSSDVAEAEQTASLTVQAAPIAIQRQTDTKDFDPTGDQIHTRKSAANKGLDARGKRSDPEIRNRLCVLYH